jgi:hypothetical protein
VETSDTSVMILESFSHRDRIYTLDPSGGTWARSHSPRQSEDGRTGTSGFADERLVGIRRPKLVFVAAFILAEQVNLQIGSQRFTLGKDTRIERHAIAPFAKRFCVASGETNLFLANYWWADVHEWPDDESLDFFLNMSTQLGTERLRSRFAYFWALKQGGLNTIQAAQKREWEFVDRVA